MKLFFTNLFFIIVFSVFAQEANDECVNAINLTLQNIDSPTYTQGNMGNATESTSACSGSTSTDVWFKFTANSKGNYIYLPSQSGLDLAFEIYDDCGVNSIVCVDNNSTNVSEAYYNNNFEIGQTYYIKVFLYNQSFTDAPFEIAVMDIPAPSNNECANAIDLTLQTIDNPTYTDCNLGGATESTSACSGSISTDAWFKFTANSKGNYIHLNPQSGLDLAFEIFDDCGGNSILCVNNNSTSTSEGYYNNNFEIGQTYYIKAFLYNQLLNDAPIEIAVMDVPAPINDECANSIEIPVQDETNTNYITSNIGGATESLAACTGNIATDVWFYFTATSAEEYIFISATSYFDPIFELFDGCSGSSIVCIDNNSVNYSEAYYSTDFIQGNDYYIRVFGYNQKVSDLEFEITVIDSNLTTNLETNYNNNFSFYPNPATDFIKISINDKIKSSSTIQILSITNQVILEKNINNLDVINISDLEPGIYYVSIINNKKRLINRKLIVY